MTAITIADLTNAKTDVDHIADIATSVELTATDRLGHVKDTISGAVYKITAFTDRGAWAAVTAYAVKDLVSNGGTWYVCVFAHTSSAAFATDQGSKWRVYQGVTSGDLGASSGASLVGYLPAGTGAVPTTVQAKLREIVSVADFGAAGDGVTDDTVAIQAAINSAATYSTVHLTPNATYLHTGGILLFNKSIEMNGATFDFTHTGNKPGIEVRGRASVTNGYFINNGSPSGVQAAAGQRDLVCLDVMHCKFENLVFKSGSNDYSPFVVFGNSYDVSISNIEFESGNFDMGVIVHWATDEASTLGTLQGFDIAVSPPTASNKTTHPHNITISNVKCGDFTVAGSLVSGIFLSGTYDIAVNNLEVGSIARAMTIYAGDYAQEFVPSPSVAYRLSTGITVNNVTAYSITGVYGILIDGQGILGALSRSLMRVSLENINLRKVTVGNSYGILVRASDNFCLRSSRTTGFSWGIILQRYVSGATIDSTTITEATSGGVLVESDVSDNSNIKITNCYIYNNNTGVTAAGRNSGICVATATGVVLTGNVFGVRGGTENQYFAIYLEDTADNVVISNNLIEESFSSVGISAELVTQYSHRFWDGGGNASDIAFIFDATGHVFYKSIGLGRKEAMLNVTSSVPTTGTWQQGDAVLFRFTAAGGFRGAVCTTAGTPGTWKTFGAITP